VAADFLPRLRAGKSEIPALKNPGARPEGHLKIFAIGTGEVPLGRGRGRLKTQVEPRNLIVGKNHTAMSNHLLAQFVPSFEKPKAHISRRSALKQIGVGAGALGALGLLRPDAMGRIIGPNSDNAALALQDGLILNFALNLEYLEAEYYTYAVTGGGIEAQGVGVDGGGTAGATTVKSGARVPFATAALQQYAMEIAADERAHVSFLRKALQNAGVQPVARPAINLLDSFAAAAQAAGLGAGFDPFANETNFLLGAFIFEDVGVTAYKGASPFITNKTFLESAAGILGVEAYHAGIIRTLLYQGGAVTRAAAQAISDLRDTAAGGEQDQGLTDGSGNANLVPADANGIAFSRTTRQVLNIVYLAKDAKTGGFFPNGVNGAVA
jgi:hypothetical protein